MVIQWVRPDLTITNTTIGMRSSTEMSVCFDWGVVVSARRRQPVEEEKREREEILVRMKVMETGGVDLGARGMGRWEEGVTRRGSDSEDEVSR